jgi:hypothetical protein
MHIGRLALLLLHPSLLQQLQLDLVTAASPQCGQLPGLTVDLALQH